MIYTCDGCKKTFRGNPKTISAKEWNVDICISLYERELGGCDAVDCRYNIEGDICISFDYCPKCAKRRSIVDNIFKTVKPFNW